MTAAPNQQSEIPQITGNAIFRQKFAPVSRVPWLFAVTAATTVLSGPQLYILGTADIYLEPILWSAAMAAAFNLIVLHAALGEGGLRRRDLVALAVLAGLAINTRPTIGVVSGTARR
jgi:hypothetical protein